MNLTRLISLPIFLLLMLQSTSYATEGGVTAKSNLTGHNLGLGRVVFNEQCIKCHGDPESGAPQLGKERDWKSRLAASLPTLIGHAINGHGKMPPKGGFDELSDRHVAAAVAYVVDRSRTLFVEQDGKTIPRHEALCGSDLSPQNCNQARINNTLLLQMLWLITGQENP